MRLVRRIRADFPDEVGDVVERLTNLALPLAEKQSRERILAAVVIAARGDRSTLDWGMRMATRDWRDVLMNFDRVSQLSVNRPRDQSPPADK